MVRKTDEVVDIPGDDALAVTGTNIQNEGVDSSLKTSESYEVRYVYALRTLCTLIRSSQFEYNPAVPVSGYDSPFQMNKDPFITVLKNE